MGKHTLSLSVRLFQVWVCTHPCAHVRPHVRRCIKWQLQSLLRGLSVRVQRLDHCDMPGRTGVLYRTHLCVECKGNLVGLAFNPNTIACLAY